MRLTITGANSLLGRASIMTLSALGHSVRAVDTRIDPDHPSGVETVIGDIRDRDFSTRVTADTDVVLHLAPLWIDGMDDATVIDTFSRGSYNLVDIAIDQGVSRFLVASTLRMFDRLPANWNVDENWRPRPEPTLDQLSCWLSELSLRESCHTAPIRATCLRFGEIVTDTDIAGKVFDPRWLYLEDAVQAICCGVRKLEAAPTRAEWEIYHISGSDESKIQSKRAQAEGFGYKPTHTFAEAKGQAAKETNTLGKDWRRFLAPTPLVERRAQPDRKRKVVIFGSGGPVSAALAEELKDDYILRQTDARVLSDVRGEDHPQSEGAPLPTILPAPHEERVVDVRDYAQVLSACEGMDAIYNCTVIRPDPVEAFRVNTLGAYNVMKAAAALGIRRVIQTGPQQNAMDSRTGYWWDYDVCGNAPARPGRQLYAHSKFLGEEICRVFAEYYGLEVPVLLYAQFLNPEVTRHVWSMAVSWKDSARALRRALEVKSLPSAYEEMVITNDLPHGRYSAQRAKEVLGWVAQDDLSALWERGTER